jgi:hypothetical protein
MEKDDIFRLIVTVPGRCPEINPALQPKEPGRWPEDQARRCGELCGDQPTETEMNCKSS